MEEEDVSAVEDLMREHGILSRVLLIYEELVRRMKNNISFNPLIVYHSALTIRKFVEDYHEHTEEKYVFPILQKHKKYTDIVNELLTQHNLGRILTDLIIKYSKNIIITKNKLILCIELFIKMYRQHEVIEDTMIFPEFKKLLTKEEYKEYGELFEKEETEVIGYNGFKKYLNLIISMEKYLDINDLHKITNEIQLAIKLSTH